MKSFLTPRLTEPLAAALMGAGFFIFSSAMAGGFFWSSAEEALWRRLQGHSPAALPEAVWIRGHGHESLSVAQRRLALASDLELLSKVSPKLIVLESWLDQPSQLESEAILTDLLDSSKSLPQKSAKSLRATVASLKTRLNADESLATAIQKAGNVVLPLAAEAATELSPVSGTVWEKAHPYEVTLKGRGGQRFDNAWRIVRAPAGLFRDAAQGLALVSPPSTDAADAPVEVPGIFQVRGRWVNGIGFDAARQAMDLPAKGLHFLWREGHLTALEMRGARFPMSTRGGFWLPRASDRARLGEMELDSFEDVSAVALLRNKVVFYQPWPETFVGEDAFARQRELCAAVLSRRVQAPPEPHSELWLAAIFWLLCAASIAALPLWISWAAPLSLGGVEAWRFSQLQAPLARPLGLLAAGLLFGMGLRLLAAKRRRDERRLWLRGHVASAGQALWEELIAVPEEGAAVEGVYIAASSAEKIKALQWSAWAARHKAFCEITDSRCLGFLIPVAQDGPYPLEAIHELRAVLPDAGFSSVRGLFSLAAERVFDSVTWSLASDAKAEALELLSLAKPGAWCMTELDYPSVRQHVKIQLIAEKSLVPGAPMKRIFNIHQVF